jgi:hypothetical protein
MFGMIGRFDNPELRLFQICKSDFPLALKSFIRTVAISVSLLVRSLRMFKNSFVTGDGKREYYVIHESFV